MTDFSGSAPHGVRVIAGEPITTLEQLEAVYQQACVGRRISEIAPILSLRNKALEAFAVSETGTPPMKPTTKMIEAGADTGCFIGSDEDCNDHIWRRKAQTVYEAMVAAAPVAAAPKETRQTKAEYDFAWDRGWDQALESAADVAEHNVGFAAAEKIRALKTPNTHAELIERLNEIISELESPHIGRVPETKSIFHDCRDALLRDDQRNAP